MEKDYVFLSEKGEDLTGYVFLDIGDKIINANGEWTVTGIINDVEKITNITNGNGLFSNKKIETTEYHSKRKFIFRRKIYDKEQKQTEKYS